MTDFELIVATVCHCGPWFALVIAGVNLFIKLDERRNFRRYEQWRLNESKRRLESIR